MKELVFIIFAIILFWFIFTDINKGGKEVRRIEKEFIDNVGKRIVIDKDTSMIIDYSFVNSNYTLANGKTISCELLSKIKVIK